MKTSVTMVRRMGQFDVSQRTGDGMFNATSLLKQWNDSATVKRSLDKYFLVKGTKELVEEIVKREKLDTPKMVYLKKRGKNGGTWMHPMLFVDFCMYVNATFRYDVLKFISDQLMEFRNESGDLTKELNSSVQRFSEINYPQLAKGLNHIVYGKHKSGIRNTGTEKQTKKMVDLQKKLAFACDMGYIGSFDQLLEEMRRIWNISR